MLTIRTRRQAAEAGLKRFYTGRPCKFGHDAERFTTTGGCVKCNAARSKLFAADTSRAVLARSRGQFVYPCHPDDMAALLAYAQGLDLARGRPPHQPDVAAPQFHQPTAADIAAMRRAAIGFAADQDVQSASRMEWRDPGEIVEPIRKQK